MQSEAKFLGMVRVWREGDAYKAPVGQWPPENAKLVKRLKTDDGEALCIDRGTAGEFIRGAVKR